MKLSEFDTDRTYKAEVVSSERITGESTAEVRHIVMRITDPTFQVIEGQSVAVLVPGPHAFGNEYHIRLYSIASSHFGEDDSEIAGFHLQPTEFSLCVRRCSYVDEVSGERYPGVASNYLCDRCAGDNVEIAGPFGRQFTMPQDPTCNLLMIGVGTGIAPFRAFVKHIYERRGNWEGKVRLFYGARTGMDLLYMNDRNGDIANYYDQETFKAFEALSSRPHLDEPDVDRTLKDNGGEVWSLLQDPKTYAYVSGLSNFEDKLDATFAELAGSDRFWQQVKGRMIEDGRWSTLFYE